MCGLPDWRLAALLTLGCWEEFARYDLRTPLSIEELCGLTMTASDGDFGKPEPEAAETLAPYDFCRIF